MISIVIPAYNEEKIITKCLNSLVAQETSQEVEVIVVNNNSTDQTEGIAKSYQNKLLLKVILEEEKGRGAARYAGFRAARGDLIFSTDADTVVPKNWIEEMTKYFQNQEIVAVTGTCKIDDCSWVTNLLFNFFQPWSMLFFRMIFGCFWLSGFNFAVRKEAYLKSGGFNPKLNAQEDVDLGFKVGKVGKVRFVTTPFVIFSGRRFQGNPVRGVVDYLRTFVECFALKKEDVYLKDVR